VTIPLNDSASMNVAASTDRLSEIRGFIRDQVDKAGFSDVELNNIVLAVDEACANLIQHAYHNDARFTISLRVMIQPDQIRVEISDTSAPFDPGKAILPDMKQYFAENRHHGLGILLMTRVMDNIEYTAAGGGSKMNTLVLTKFRTV